MNRTQSSPMGLSPRFARAKHLPFRHLDGQTVIVDPHRREVHVLNGMASTIWDLLGDETHTVWDLVAALEHDGGFDVPMQTVADDLDGFLTNLVQKGLVSASGPAIVAAG